MTNRNGSFINLITTYYMQFKKKITLILIFALLFIAGVIIAICFSDSTQPMGITDWIIMLLLGIPLEICLHYIQLPSKEKEKHYTIEDIENIMKLCKSNQT